MLKYAPKHVMTKVGVAETIPFADGKFRCVLIGEALHHFKSPRKAFREIARVLEADGTLFIFDFDPTTLTGGMICRAERLLGEPGNFFPPETLCRLLRRTGFQAEHEKFGWRYVVRAQRLGD
jgi:demethylmenaquinone methyltransferase/2-methoxy-6-polyprenyl-1,4-benzoquinol methylase